MITASSGERRLSFLSVTAALASAGMWVLVPPPTVRADGSNVLIAALALVILYAVAEAWPLSLEHRGETFAFTLNGVPLAVGLVFAGPLGLLVGRLIGTAVTLAGFHHQSRLKIAVNLVGMSLEIWAACHSFSLITRGVVDMGQPAGWAAVAAAVIVADTVTGGVVLAAIRLSVGRLEVGAVKAVLVGNVINFAVGIPLAMLTALTLSIDLRSAVVLIPVALLLAQTNQQRHTLSTRLGTTQQLYRFISDLAEPTTVTETLERVLEKAQAVMGATHASLVLLDGERAHAWHVVADGVTSREVAPRPVERLMDEAAAGLLLVPGDALLVRYGQLLTTEPEQVLVVRVLQADVRGLLVLADRAGNLALFDGDDVQVLNAIAGHAGTALAEAGLLERLRSDARERERMALTDGQSGLPNRDGLLATQPLLRDGSVMIVEIRDLTEFEAGFGHAVAAGIAGTVGELIGATVADGDHDIVARLGIGRYAVVCPGPVSQADAAARARHLAAAASGPVQQGDLVIDVGVRVGVALAPQHGTVVAELLRAADRGLREANEEDRAVGWFDVGRDRETTRRLELASELRVAIEEGHLRLAYQPKVDLSSGRVVGLEALARWPHAQRGFIAPSEFIDVAERTGLIRPLTMWALRASLQQMVVWARDGLVMPVAVNLSNAALLDADIAREIVALIDRYALPPGSVVLEITESQMMGDVQRGSGVLSIFNAAGIPLSVDDFGTGYSSLAHLKLLDVQELKIDRAFITNLAADPTDRALCSAIIGMAQELGLQVVGEGIEDAAALQILRDLGCQVGQGHFFARPVPASQLPAVVADIEGRLADGSIARLQDRARRSR